VSVARVFPVFSAVFAALYLAAMYWNLALVSYFPRTRQWYALTVTGLPRSAGPGMYWYGWLLTSFFGAALAAALALALPAHAGTRVARSASWGVPFAVIATLAFILRGWFIH
jgi:hypothetical protein